MKLRAAPAAFRHMLWKITALVAILVVMAFMMKATPVRPSSQCDSFGDGYRNYLAGRPPIAIQPLTAAADGCPGLADYSLYYLGLAQRDSGNLAASEEALSRMANDYPQSVMAGEGMLALGQVQFKLGRYADAARCARRALARSQDQSEDQSSNPSEDQSVGPSAMLLLGQALQSVGDYRGAYQEFNELRDSYPESTADGAARTAAYAILAAHPEVTDSLTADYHRREGELLIREGESDAAQTQIKAALQFFQPPGGRADLLWLLARAQREDPALEKSTILQCLAAAPPAAIEAAARDRLGHLYWRADDTENARRQFELLATEFPNSDFAPEALLAIGKSYDDDHSYDVARTTFERVLAHYPDSDQAEQARFLIPWSYFMTGRYADAARSFSTMEARANSAADRDMSSYWLARSIAMNGDRAGADAIYRRLAASTASNYYPALAAMRIGAAPPASVAPELAFDQFDVPAVTEPAARFHLDRALALRGLGLSQLETGELHALEPIAGLNTSIRNYLLGAMQAAGAWYDALVTATRLQKDGHLSAAASERIRYPMAFPDLIVPTARHAQVPPYLVLSLTRQESLFDPDARSGSDARGLMQLLPSTAARMASANGASGANATTYDDSELYDPAVNVRLGVTYLSKLLAMYGGNHFKAVAAYNAGEHAVDRWNEQNADPDDVWVENIGFRETRDYVKKVIGGLREYEILYGPAGG